MNENNHDLYWRKAFERVIIKDVEFEGDKADFGRPDFLCIGAQKSATTWLYASLASHPIVWLPPVKEIGFFNSIHIPAVREESVAHRRRQVDESRKWWLEPGRNPRVQSRRLACLDVLDSDLLTDEWYSKIFTFHGSDQLCGDINPDYGMVPRAGVRHALGSKPNHFIEPTRWSVIQALKHRGLEHVARILVG
jgi:hypothetical protein